MATAHRGAPRPIASILLATDFSPGSRNAERRVLHLSKASGPTIHLLHVLPGTLEGRTLGRAWTAAGDQLARVAARMRRMARALGLAEPELIPSVAQGAPHVEVVRRSRRAGAELVVMGRHGRGSHDALVVGTTSGRVVRFGDAPVLVVNAKPLGPYRRTFVGVDLEDASSPLVVLATRLAEPGAELLLVHVCQPPALARLVSWGGSARDRAADRLFDARRAAGNLKALVKALQEQAPGFAMRHRVLHGDPRRLLPRQAASWRADLLAVGTHGRTGLSRMLLGSVAERALAAARCDVLVSRPARFTFQFP